MPYQAIGVVGGEPEDSAILQNSIKSGLKKKEVLFFYSYRKVASWRQGDPSRAHSPPNPQKEIEHYIAGDKKRLGLEKLNFGHKDFVKMYKNKMG